MKGLRSLLLVVVIFSFTRGAHMGGWIAAWGWVVIDGVAFYVLFLMPDSSSGGGGGSGW